MKSTTKLEELKTLIVWCDDHLKRGSLKPVVAELRKLNLAKIPRELRWPLAQICRRSNQISTGLRLLSKVIHGNRLDPAIPEEILEYSALLARNGSIEEGLRRIGDLDGTSLPEVFFMRGYCHVLQWNYSAAVGEFESYLKLVPMGYLSLIVRTNLAASYLGTGRFHEAGELIAENVEIAKQQGAHRLLGNALELRAQLAYASRRFTDCESCLHEAERLVAGEEHYRMFVAKWQAVLSARREGSYAPLLKFRKEAVRLRHWDTVREADLYALVVKFDQGLMDFLIFGTPSDHYRRRIHLETGGNPSPEFLWGGRRKKKLRLSDPGSGRITGSKVHQLLVHLCSDFYGTLSVGALFGKLFPDEYFDIRSSDERIRQLIKRLRAWISSENLDMAVEYDGGYAMRLGPGTAVEIELGAKPVPPRDLLFDNLAREFTGQRQFSSREAMVAFDISKSTANRVLTEMVDKGILIRIGSGRSVQYQVVRSNSTPLAK